MPRIITGARLYFLAVLSALVALLLRKMLSPVLGPDNPYLIAWAAVVISAWYCGVGPAVVATLLSVLGVWYWFLPYFQTFAFQNPKAEISGMILFLVLATLIIALGDANRRSKARLQREAAERSQIENDLRRAYALLEDRVQERTAQLSLTNDKLSEEAEKTRAQAEWLDGANDAIFVSSCEGKITYWNNGAERLYGWTRAEATDKSPHELLQTEFPVPFAEIATEWQRGGWQGELVHTRRDESRVTVASRWTPLKDLHNNLTGWLEINRDITDRKAAEAARELSGQLMKIQDEERRRIARELHDNTGQMVVALLLNLGRLRASGNLSLEETRLLSESDALLQTVNTQLCAISHLLHPLLLDEVGLWTALEWYVEGFRRRSGIPVILERDSNVGRLNSSLEVALYRVVQECLSSMHHHSGSPGVTIRLLRSFGEVRLEIQDRRRTITTEQQLSVPLNDAMGVGLRGMRERILQLGGNLSVESNRNGTTIIVTFPISERADASNDELAVA